MNFEYKEYLLNSEKRIKRLRNIINGRPVAILAAGPSIKELEKRISQLLDADICYFGLNNFSTQETHILRQIDKHISVMMNSDRECMPMFIKNIFSFLDCDDNNMLVSSFWRNTFELLGGDFNFNQFLNKYDEKLIFFSLSFERTVPNSNKPLHFISSNSLLLLIQLAIIGKASKIVLFGADGYCKKEEDCYYHSNEYAAGYAELARQKLIDDTNVYFNPIAAIAIRNTYKTYNLPSIDILNCSEKTFYTPFPKLSYNDAFEYLLQRKKFSKSLDLRIPKVSVISPYLNSGSVVEAIENISHQSYSNFEYIIIYNQEDAQIQDRQQQFSYVKWIPGNNIKPLPAFEKGISIARGDYLFYCPIGNRYLNQDWFNTCVEILENNPDISLVWGLSQRMHKDGSGGEITDAHFLDNPPPQGKKFIYYWLKKKILFPERNFCVRKKVLEECFPFQDSKINDELEAWTVFNYRFNISGYQPYFVPIVANYCQIQANQAQSAESKWIKTYYADIEQYKNNLVKGKITHHYRQGFGEPFPYGFDRSIFLFFDFGRLIKAKLPHTLLFSDFEKVLDYWMGYRWAALKIGMVKVWKRLTKSWPV